MAIIFAFRTLEIFCKGSFLGIKEYWAWDMHTKIEIHFRLYILANINVKRFGLLGLSKKVFISKCKIYEEMVPDKFFIPAVKKEKFLPKFKTFLAILLKAIAIAFILEVFEIWDIARQYWKMGRSTRMKQGKNQKRLWCGRVSKYSIWANSKLFGYWRRRQNRRKSPKRWGLHNDWARKA